MRLRNCISSVSLPCSRSRTTPEESSSENLYHEYMSLPTLDQVRNVARRTAANHGVGEMYVYGSVARGDNGPHSDVDFIYRLNAGNKATAGVVLSLKDDLESELGSPVSLLSMRTLLFNAEHTASGKRFYDSIKNDLTRIV
ncbi:hypothetical protein CUU80_02045 [Bifidobacterium scaligerum]|uniref:Polymerase nucleotidyl transferase domain-containing protein n=2 Tax=Bifidobacterium scaligerum TaxID=2052656 RepID=A0A2M9HT06_9BIFI|nr:hypothetical protein CUU80_02045 [Bifidobacterium scaligerum]